MDTVKPNAPREPDRPLNPTIALMDARCSTRAYDPTPLTDTEKRTILHTTMRAPTAGNLMLYSIIEIEDQALKDRLAVTCDDQPFIARAPWVLLFVADYQKWMDLFAAADVDAMEGVPHGVRPGAGDLLLACCDALIAAQNAVIAAESLGIGACYIGDIMERFEFHRDLLNLPQYTFPVTMVCFGYPTPAAAARQLTSRFPQQMIHHRDRYQRLDGEALLEAFAAGAPPRFAGDPTNAGQRVYDRKFGADFSLEMTRSVRAAIRAWALQQAP